MHDNLATAPAVSSTIGNEEYELMIRDWPIAYHFERNAFSTLALLTPNCLCTSLTAFV